MKHKQLAPYLRQFYRGALPDLVLALLGTLGITAVNLLVSWLIQQIIDLVAGVEIGRSVGELAALAGLSILLLLFTCACMYFSKPRFIARAVAQYREYVFARIVDKGIAAFSREGSATYLSALTADVAEIENGYLCNLFIILDQSVLLVGAMAMMLWYSPVLTAISVVIALLPLVTSLCTGGLVAKAEQAVSARNEQYVSRLRDSLGGFSVIKSFRAEGHIRRMMREAVWAVAEAKTARRRMIILTQTCALIAGNVLQIGILLVGTLLALSGTALSAGSVLIFVQLLNFVINPIATIPGALAECRSAYALIGKVADALEKNVREEGAVALTGLREGIVLDGVSFAYEAGVPVLEAVNMRFAAGRAYCVVGGSGSGKSTLLQLLMAAHTDYAGQIRYDGVELREIESGSLYGAVSQIGQEVFLFDATVRENITLFADFDDEAVERAIALSGLSSLIAERGEDYRCGEGGAALSGGERQRIAIARALLRRAEVLLVDEATASLDAETAHAVSSAILDLAGMTRIVVTHRLEASLLARYDEIVVLREGSVVERGTFAELITRGGYFSSLYTMAQ